MMVYPPGAGRNFSEIPCVNDGLQTSDQHNVTTPVDWTLGDPAIIPSSIPNEVAKEMFPQGWKELKLYLRIVELLRV